MEEHGWTVGIREALNALPPERQDQSIGFFNVGETDAQLLDYDEKRVALLDDMGMDVAVLSITTPATQILDPVEAVKLAVDANDQLAAAVAGHPDGLAAFATRPTPDPAAAVDELTRAVTELGFRGAMIHGRAGDKMLDHPDFAPILDEAARLEVPIFIHPQMPHKAVSDLYYGGFPHVLFVGFSSGGWGWHVEAAVNAIRLILSGTFERAPGLQVILGHWGELIPFYLERVDVMAPMAHLPRSPAEYFREHFWCAPSGIWSYQLLNHALAEVGADRMLFAIDSPFQRPTDGSIRRWLENAPISELDKHKIGHLNAERLLKLPG